jgi:aerobic carbon-monoxide dehydrogenase small subunit
LAEISLAVNGKSMTADIEARTLLVDLLRTHLELTGTHVGCDTSQCGCCTVLVDGIALKSCTALAISFDGASVTTIEGLDVDGKLHPMQEAFHEHHALQCGFCTPGMIMSAIDMVRRNGSALDERTVRKQLEGNLCRCTGYHNIVKAIQAGAAAMQDTGSAPSGETSAGKRPLGEQPHA